jgi:nicotinate-nucleotide adenylyltransferase
MKTYQRLGMMGGTFDPIHYGHLVAAEEARCQLELEKVIFIPAGRPPHKTKREISAARHRLNITRLAVASNPFFRVSDVEIMKPGPSYTIDTVQIFKEKFPGAELFFITGADAVLEILSWKRVEELLRLCYFVAATRPGYQLDELSKNIPGFPINGKKRIITMEVPALAISSTDLRRRVREGRPIKYLVPEAVEAYILNNNLYRLHPNSTFQKNNKRSSQQ